MLVSGESRAVTLLHPWRLTWNIVMEVWKIIFLSKWVTCRFQLLIFQGVISFTSITWLTSLLHPPTFLCCLQQSFTSRQCQTKGRWFRWETRSFERKHRMFLGKPYVYTVHIVYLFTYLFGGVMVSCIYDLYNYHSIIVPPVIQRLKCFEGLWKNHRVTYQLLNAGFLPSTAHLEERSNEPGCWVPSTWDPYKTAIQLLFKKMVRIPKVFQVYILSNGKCEYP